MRPKKKKSSASNINILTVLDMMPHPGQMTIMKSKHRFRVVACGRRFGKTEVGKWLILDYAMNRNYACWWVSPTYRMASQVWRDLKRMSRNFEQLTVSQDEMRIDAKKGGSIEIRSAHLPDVLRGAGLNFVVLDEAAFMPPEIWGEIVRPMLSDKSGGALFLSTPYGRNWFYDLYMAGRDRKQQEWRSFQYTSYQNPYIPREEIDSIRAATSSSVFRAEYMAEFLDDDGLVFRGIHAAATAPAHPRPLEGRLYVGGIDWGRSRDFTVITLIDAETRQVVAVERFNQVGWALQRGRIAALCALWKPAYLWAEENSIGAVNLEALQADGVPVRPFKTTAASKAPLIEALALAIERAELALLPEAAPHGDIVLSELAAYSLKRMPGGGIKYSAPAGLHDDCVISLALAWHGVANGGSAGIDWA